jgi:hypothetical protein
VLWGTTAWASFLSSSWGSGSTIRHVSILIRFRIWFICMLYGSYWVYLSFIQTLWC